MFFELGFRIEFGDVKPYLKLISGVPEIGFIYGLNKFSGPNSPNPYLKLYFEDLVEYFTCPQDCDISRFGHPFCSRSKDGPKET